MEQKNKEKILLAMEELTFYPVEGCEAVERVEKTFKIKVDSHSNFEGELFECLDDDGVLIKEKALEYWRVYQSAFK